MIDLNKTGLKVAVHNGVMHADDVFSVAAIAIVNPYVNIIRTRDKALLDICDLRVDVGNKYDPETGDFDLLPIFISLLLSAGLLLVGWLAKKKKKARA